MKTIDQMLDLLWDYLEPRLPDCRVCAFLRGAGFGLLAGCIGTLVVLWLV